MSYRAKPAPGKTDLTSIESPQLQRNRAVYESSGVYRAYLSDRLTPSESACLAKYQAFISGRAVLDIGVGAGRTTYHLRPVARRYEAIDYSSVMVRCVRQRIPGISVQQADFRDLHMFSDQSFDFVLASSNIIDALSHEGRMQALGEAKRVLRPGGKFAFSSHNLNYKKLGHCPQVRWSVNPLKLGFRMGEYLLSWYNYLRFLPLRNSTPEYALLNDPGHHFACLHYYVKQSTVGIQLNRFGLRLIEVFDYKGQVLQKERDNSENPSLLYVAERVPD